MAQESGPLTGQTFTDAMWRSIIGDEPGIVGDVDRSAYRLTLPTASNSVILGSPSQDSTSVVGGFMHRIAAGQTQELEIPAAVGAPRTDIIAVRYDPAAFTTEPGPCRLYRIAGSTTAEPAFDSGPPGAEDMPLYAITRAPGQALSQATVRDMRRRRGPTLALTSTRDLGEGYPLGTVVHLPDGSMHSRQMGSVSPVWIRRPPTNITPIWGGTQDFKTQAGRRTVTTDGDGIGEIVFPVPFPSGILSLSLTHADDVIANDVGLGIVGGAPLGNIRFRVWGPNGGGPGSYARVILRNFTVTVAWMAIGW